MTHRNLFIALWLGWMAYWFIASGNVKTNRRHESLASRLGHTLPLALAVALLALPLRAGWARAYFLWPSQATYWLGLAMTVAGLGFACWARVHIGRNWSGTVTVKQDHELVRDGPYRWVRHPIYTGLLLAMLGSAIAPGEWRGLLAVALASYAFIRKLRLEERWMSEQFPAGYADYRGKVAALVPFLYWIG